MILYFTVTIEYAILAAGAPSLPQMAYRFTKSLHHVEAKAFINDYSS